VVISDKGLAYRRTICEIIAYSGSKTCLTGRLGMNIDAYPPDRRRRDLDNILKALLDSMEHAGVYKDDNQIDELSIIRRKVEKPGFVMVNIEELITMGDSHE